MHIVVEDDLYVQDRDGHTALHLAAMGGHTRILELLAEAASL